MTFSQGGLWLPGIGDPADLADMTDALSRNLRAVEDWANSPHTTYGSFSISPFFYDELVNVDTLVNVPPKSGGTYLEYDFPHMPFAVDRPFKLFAVAIAELENTSPGLTDTGVKFFVAVAPSWGTKAYGRETQQFYPGNSKRYIHTNIRHYADVPTGTDTTLTLSWAFQCNDASAVKFDIVSLRCIYALFYAPDAQAPTGDAPDVPARWTADSAGQTAYRYTGESTATSD